MPCGLFCKGNEAVVIHSLTAAPKHSILTWELDTSACPWDFRGLVKTRQAHCRYCLSKSPPVLISSGEDNACRVLLKGSQTHWIRTKSIFQCVLHSRHSQALEVQWGTKPNNSISFVELTVWGHPKKTRAGRHAIFFSVCFSLTFLGHGPHSSKNILPEIWIRSNHFSDYETKTYENKQTEKEQQPLMPLPRPGWLSYDTNPSFHPIVL